MVRLNERDHLLSAQLLDTLRDGVYEICLGHTVQGVRDGSGSGDRRYFDFYQRMLTYLPPTYVASLICARCPVGVSKEVTKEGYTV